MPLLGRAIGENRQMAWGFLHSRELELRVARRAFAVLRVERVGVAACEIVADRRSGGIVVDDDETPRLT